jgi:hypothetical protein
MGRVRNMTKDSSAVDELKNRNETLSRELAECVREVIEYQHAYRELRDKTVAIKQVFVNFLISNEYYVSPSAAHEYVDEMARRELNDDVEVTEDGDK